METYFVHAEYETVLAEIFPNLVANRINDYMIHQSFHPQLEHEEIISDFFTELVAKNIINFHRRLICNQRKPLWCEILIELQKKTMFGKKVVNIPRIGDFLCSWRYCC